MGCHILLDTSDVDMSIGIAVDGKLVRSVSYPAWLRQSELLVFELDKLLSDAGLGRNDIIGVMSAIGPGSYTGIRISLTVAKTIAIAIHCPLYPVSSLLAMCRHDRECIAVMNARSSRSYVGIYDGVKCLFPDSVIANDEAIKIINEHPNALVVGDASYLGINWQKPDVLKQMLDIFPEIHSADNPFGVKPVYLKETYETHI